MHTSQKCGLGVIGIAVGNVPTYLLYKNCKQELINKDEIVNDLKTLKKVLYALAHIAHPNHLKRRQARYVIKKHKFLAACILAEVASVSALTVKGFIEYVNKKEEKKKKKAEEKSKYTPEQIEQLRKELKQNLDIIFAHARTHQATPGPGFTNLITTCYSNASYQLLAEIENTEEQDAESVPLADLKKAQHEIQRILPQLTNKAYKFKKKGRKGSYSQEDAEEFITILMEQLKITKPIKVENYIHDDGATKPELSTSTEDSMIKIPLQQAKGLPAAKSIQQALEQKVLVKERMTGESGHNKIIDGETKKVDATKYLQFSKLPTQLIVELQRFGFSTTTGRRFKIKRKITPNMSLNIPTKTGHDVFSPKAVIVHQGNTPNSGHYYTYKKDSDGNWVEYNDRSVSIPNQRQAARDIKENGYLFLYEKQKSYIRKKAKKVAGKRRSTKRKRKRKRK
jgi:uncharacterized UBP type Zn finger protein